MTSVMKPPNDSGSIKASPQTNRGDVLMLFLHLRNTELNALWTRFNIYLAINGGLLGAFLGFSIDKDKIGAIHPYILLLGLALSLIWLRSESVGRETLAHRDKDLKAIYEKFFSEYPKEEDRYLQYPEKFKRQQHLSLVLIALFIVAWVLLIARNLYA